jgi:hypothetical protein
MHHVKSNVEEEQQQQQQQQQQQDERKDEESSDDDGWTYPKSNMNQPRRQHVWHTQPKLVDGGLSSIVAANDALISRITGARTVTQAIEKIIGCFKRLYRDSGGIHPELQYGSTRRLPQQQQQQQQLIVVNV